MTRRFKPITLDGVSHMIDDPQGDWVRWCDCREVEGELARVREGMPSRETIESLEIDAGPFGYRDLISWLRRLADAGGEA